MTKDLCPRCNKKSVTIENNPNRKGGAKPQKNDKREYQCGTQGCWWWSYAIYDGKDWVWKVTTYAKDKKKGRTRY